MAVGAGAGAREEAGVGEGAAVLDGEDVGATVGAVVPQPESKKVKSAILTAFAMTQMMVGTVDVCNGRQE